MKKILFIIFSLIVLSAKAQYPGTNLRGQVQVAYNNTYVPYPNASIGLYALNAYNNWVLVSQAITNEFGFYFFYGIPPGPYSIQINGLKNYSITVVMIDYRFYQFQDVPVLFY